MGKSRKSDGIKVPKVPEIIPEKEYKFVVIYLAMKTDYLGNKVWYEREVHGFSDSESAVRFAEGKKDARVFGLNPEYEFTVIRSITVKEGN